MQAMHHRDLLLTIKEGNFKSNEKWHWQNISVKTQTGEAKTITQNRDLTLPKTNVAHENWPSQKETIVFQPSIFRCKLAVSFREGISLHMLNLQKMSQLDLIRFYRRSS